MYAKALSWESQDGAAKQREVESGGNTKLLVTPVHKMYAKVELVEIDQDTKLMLLDKTGSGSVTFYQTVRGSNQLCNQQAEESSCELLQDVRGFVVSQQENKVYVSGGFDLNDESPVNAFIMFDGDIGEWRLLSGMNKARFNHTMVHWNDGFLVTGGETNSERRVTPTCEFYNIATDKWTMFEGIPEARSFHSCVVHNGSLYVSGGLDMRQQPNTSLWIYESATSKWSTLDVDYPVTLPYGLAKHKMVSHYDSIYLIGGVCKDRQGVVKATSRIISFKPQISYLGSGALSQNIDKNKYDRVTPWSHDHKHLSEPLYNFAVIGIGNSLLIIGGSGSKANCNESYTSYEIEHHVMKTIRITARNNQRRLPINCDGVILNVNRRKALQQLVPRNWPLW